MDSTERIDGVCEVLNLQTVYKRLPKLKALSVKRVLDVESCKSWRRAGPTAERRILLRKVFRILCNILDDVCCLRKLELSLIKGIWVEEVCLIKCFVDGSGTENQ